VVEVDPVVLDVVSCAREPDSTLRAIREGENMNRMMMLGAVLVAWFAATSPASAHLVQIRGGVTCAAWNQQRPKNSRLLETWLLGYLSGMAQEADKGLPAAVEDDEIFRWMDAYCKENAKQGVNLGGYMLFGKWRSDGKLK
jgi:hypothetical protein